MAPQAGANDSIFHYAPDEICIVVEHDRGTGADGRDEERHEAVRRWLNRNLRDHLPAEGVVDANDPFELDLAPPAAPGRWEELDGPLQPLGWAAGHSPRPSGGPRACIILPRPGRPTTALHLFQIGAGQGDAGHPRREGREVVRQLVNVVNRRLLHRQGTEPGLGQWSVLGATPHWLASGAQGPAIGGGPSAPPEPVPPKLPPPPQRFHFENPRLEALVADQRRSAAGGGSTAGVIVAILDTSPTAEAVAAASQRHQENWLLREVAEHVTIEGTPSLQRDALHHLQHYIPSWPGRMTHWVDDKDAASREEYYAMPDHGLFIAGIVRDIAPGVDIRLIRALDDAGSGDLLALIEVLAALPGRLLRGPDAGKRLVVNLSLMVDVPSSEDLLAQWFPATTLDPDALRRHWYDVAQVLSAIHRSLAEVIAWLREQGILVVAAAGNDALGAERRPEPRIPARYESVLSVAAVDTNWEPAGYSNRGDTAVLSNGVAVFGGNAVSAAPDERPEIMELRSGRRDAIVGIFSAEKLPLDGGPNRTGWAYWTGTSFATAIASAVAAVVWGANPAYDPGEVMRAVRDYATLSAEALACPAIIARQEEAHTDGADGPPNQAS